MKKTIIALLCASALVHMSNYCPPPAEIRPKAFRQLWRDRAASRPPRNTTLSIRNNEILQRDLDTLPERAPTPEPDLGTKVALTNFFLSPPPSLTARRQALLEILR